VTKDNGGLNRLCSIYEQLDSGGKEEVIKLAERLLDTQKGMPDAKIASAEKMEESELVNQVGQFGWKTTSLCHKRSSKVGSS